MSRILVGVGLLVCFLASTAEDAGLIISIRPFIGLGMLIVGLGIGTLLISPGEAAGSGKTLFFYRITLICCLAAFAGAYGKGIFDAGDWSDSLVKMMAPAILISALLTMYFSTRNK